MIIFWAFIIAAAIQCRYLFYTFLRVFSLKGYKAQTIHQQKPVSIIICAKNEAENLKKNLPAILSQRYSNETGIALYEVIVINDNSTDDTELVLQDLKRQHAHLKTAVSVTNEGEAKGKKHALSIGVTIAAYNWLLMTDADCVPASDQWVTLMVAPLAERKEIVAGYGGYYAADGLLNAFIRWETLHTFIQYCSYALSGRPYMAVGRNLACTKDAFLKAQASPSWNALPSGDDDLLVSIAGTADNVAVASDPQAFTYSKAKDTWKEWKAQKQRHLSTGKYYKPATKLSLAIYATSHALLWLLFFALLFMNGSFVVLATGYMAFRCLAYWLVWALAARKLREKIPVYLFPLFDLGWMMYNFAFFPYITWKNKKTWT